MGDEFDFNIDKFVGLCFQIDTNRINANNNLECMNKLEKWDNDGIISLEISKIAFDEINIKDENLNRRRKVGHYIYSMTDDLTKQELEMINKIEYILFPNGIKNQNEKNDVEIVFNAWKYLCILITNDGGSKRQPGGILGKREELKKLGIMVMRDYEAVKLVEEAIEAGYQPCGICKP